MGSKGSELWELRTINVGNNDLGIVIPEEERAGNGVLALDLGDDGERNSVGALSETQFQELVGAQ